jgi:hypothetical protein
MYQKETLFVVAMLWEKYLVVTVCDQKETIFAPAMV